MGSVGKKMHGLKILTLVAILSFQILMLEVKSAFAQTQFVNVMVAYDEELAQTAQWVYGYSPEKFCQIIVVLVSWRFEDSFGIKFRIALCKSWDSDDSIDSIFDLLDECINEVGFYSGMTYNTVLIDILIAFTDQDTPEGYGYCDNVTKAVLVEETYYLLSLGQCTDNVLQHELSHLYGCGHHSIFNYDCVMNIFSVYLNPIEGIVPYLLTTENWCSCCREIINANRELFGRTLIMGGGGKDGPYPEPYSFGGFEDGP